MNKLIATGTVKDDGKVKIVASVYVDLLEDGTESDFVGAHYVTLSYTNNDADAQPGDAVTYADILAAASTESGSAESGSEESGDAAAMVVPGAYGHDDVELEAPYTVRYAKTKSFTRVDGTVQVYATMRYNF